MNFSHFLFDHICQAFFDKEQSAQSNSNPTIPGRIPTGNQNHLLNIFNEVDSSNENRAQNSPSDDSESLCSRVEILRGDSFDSSPANVRVEQDESSFQQDNQSLLLDQESHHVGLRDFHDIRVVDIGVSNRGDPIATTSSSSCYVGLKNLSKTCYINVLLQWLLHLVPFRNSFLECHLNVDAETLSEQMNALGLNIPNTIGHAQVTLLDLARGFLELQSLCHEMLSCRSSVVDPRSFIDAIGFPHNQSDCCHNAWITLFQFYFDFLQLSSHYRGLEVFQIGEQPQVFSCLQVYVSNIGVDKM